MATLEKIRQKAVIVTIIVALALFAFIIGDGLRSGSSWWRESKSVVMTIGKEKVKIENYEARLKAMQEQLRASGQQISDEQQMMLNNQLAQTYITDYATDEVANELGLRVTDKELSALIFGSSLPMSPISRQFFASLGIPPTQQNIANFLEQISTQNSNAEIVKYQQQWDMARAQIKTQRLQRKIGDLLSNTYKINSIDQQLTVGNESRTVNYAQVIPSAADTTARVSASEIKSYYNAHKEFFVQKYPLTEINTIALHVVPSSEDYAKAKAEMEHVVGQLDSAKTRNQISDVLRNYSQQFITPSFMTSQELQSMGLTTQNLDFLKTASVGQVNSPMVLNNRYTIIKLIAKDKAPASMGLNVIILDSIRSKKVDSLINVLNTKKETFAQMAKAISLDKRSAENGGKITAPGQYGQSLDTFTEAQLARMGVKDAYSHKPGQPFIQELGNIKAIFMLDDPKTNVDRYQFAMVNQDITFSPETYNAKYAIINNILGANDSFDAMAKKAQAEGLTISRNTIVNAQSISVGNIPSSRPIIRWAMTADKGAVNSSLYRCGTDYLVIAAVADHIPAGTEPLNLVSEQIKAKLMADKRANDLAKNLSSKTYTSIAEFASTNATNVDSLVDVTYLVKGQGPEFNGYAMTTPLKSLSKPFVSDDNVYVVYPLSQSIIKDDSELNSERLQRQTDLGRQIGQRAFYQVIKDLKIVDNRYRFY